MASSSPSHGAPQGYLSAAYGQSFRGLGRILTLPDSGLQLIERRIRDGQTDLIGLYPYAVCRDFAALTGAADQAVLRGTGAVALSFVADPFAAETVRAALAGWDLCRRFKTHFVIDLAGDWRAVPTKKTRYYVRQGYRKQQVEAVAGSPDLAPLFWRLYSDTIRRRQITGLTRLSETILADQLAVPGARLMIARAGETVTGAFMVFHQAGHGNGHLIGFDPAHYNDSTSYVLNDAAAADAAAHGMRWFNLGGPAGMADDPSDGLYNFKRRWTRTRRETLICGQVLDAPAYAALCAETGTGHSAFFPAYRAPGSALDWDPGL